MPPDLVKGCYPQKGWTMSIRIRIRDWWRGYTNDDVASAMRKTEGPHKPGAIIPFTSAEHRAWRAIIMDRVKRDMEAGR